jgi:hypothetical protein
LLGRVELRLLGSGVLLCLCCLFVVWLVVYNVVCWAVGMVLAKLVGLVCCCVFVVCLVVRLAICLVVS